MRLPYPVSRRTKLSSNCVEPDMQCMKKFNENAYFKIENDPYALKMDGNYLIICRAGESAFKKQNIRVTTEQRNRLLDIQGRTANTELEKKAYSLMKAGY